MIRDDWLQTNIFHHSQYQNIGELVRRKEAYGLTISVCLPACHGPAIAANNSDILGLEIITRSPLVDEIVVMDSGGTGDILVYLYDNIPHIQPYMIAGLVGPLLSHSHIQYVNAFYEHPLAALHDNRPFDQEYLIETFTRSLFALFFAELNAIIHPLSRVYAVRRTALERAPFTTGYGGEIFHLISIYRRWGLDALGQTDLGQFAHSHLPFRDPKQIFCAILRAILVHLSYQEIVSQIETLMGMLYVIKPS